MIEIISIKSLDDSNIRIKDQLVDLLIDGVDSKAEIGFVNPLDKITANEYWEKVNQDLKSNCRLLLIAIENKEEKLIPEVDESSSSSSSWSNNNIKVMGTIQLSWSNIFSNGKHRGEVQKLIVHRLYRGKGISKILLSSIEDYSLKLNKTLLILDTKSEDLITPKLYKSQGYIEVGSIPKFALNSNGYSGTTIFYKLLE